MKEYLLRAQQDYQRLEFLGDAILDAVVAEELYHRWPEASEAILTQMRTALVSKEALASTGRILDLDTDLLQDPDQYGELAISDRSLAVCLEAIIGAMFVDQGYAYCRHFVLQILQPSLATLTLERDYRHPKSKLQECLLAHGEELPSYSVEYHASGHPTVRCSFIWHGQMHIYKAQAPSVRKGEKQVAELAWNAIQQWLP
ncbi:MAG: ribonuclease III family protein [Gammaproteobacteria bacterium]